VTTGAGVATARLVVTKGSGVSLSVLAADGTVVATAQGLDATVQVNVAPGTYTFVVSGNGSKANFSLTITYPL
jgi:hypothetical protein